MKFKQFKIGEYLLLETASWKMIVQITKVTENCFNADVIYDNEIDGLNWNGNSLIFEKDEIFKYKIQRKLKKRELLLEMLD